MQGHQQLSSSRQDLVRPKGDGRKTDVPKVKAPISLCRTSSNIIPNLEFGRVLRHQPSEDNEYKAAMNKMILRGSSVQGRHIESRANAVLISSCPPSIRANAMSVPAGTRRAAARRAQCAAAERTNGAPPQKMDFPTVEQCVGKTPLVRLQRLPGKLTSNVILAKLEGNNPAGSVKDR